MRRLLCAVVAILLYAAPALAQTGVPTSYVLRLYVAGTTTVVGTPLTVLTSQLQCNQAAITTGDTLNATHWRWNDPQNIGKQCVFDDSARLTALTDGNYEGALTAQNADGASAESARAPFTVRRSNPPAAPTGLRIIH